MKEFFGKKIWIILLTIAALIGLIFLASGIKELNFEPSQLKNLEEISDQTSGKDVPRATWVYYIFPSLIIITILLLLGPVRPMLSKDLGMMILRFFVLNLVGMIILAYKLLQKDPQATAAGTSNSTFPRPFSSPVVSSTSEFWIAAILVVVISVTLFFILNRLISRWFQPKERLEEFAKIVRSALNDLSEDKDSGITIIHCYERMNSIVNEYRGITRKAAMTPAEFAQYLESAGLPYNGVQGLTYIFEKVRYGAQTISPEEVKEAKQCLTSILKACKAEI